MEENKQLTFLSVFSGADGLAEGFNRSEFLPIAHVEMDKDACLTIKTRIAYHYLKNNNQFDHYVTYLKKEITRDDLYKKVQQELIDTVINERITRKTLPGIFSKIDGLLGDRKVSVLIGGPPCQAYSLSGRAADDRGMRWDSRNFLYKQYGEFLRKYKPKMFVFENVPGLYSAGNGKYYKRMKNYFEEELGYKVEDKILDAADFGVVQRRKRVIIIGWRAELKYSYPEFEKIERHWCVRDVFCDLPAVNAGGKQDTCSYTEIATEYLNKFDIRDGLDFVTQHITRPHNDEDLIIYKLAIEKLENEGVRIKNNEIPEDLRTQKNVKSFLDRFKVVKKDEISHTMIAHIAKDGHHYIHPDMKQLRSISVREAARIQSFPDDYFFEGSRTSAFRQIGNAVPPAMAGKIAEKIRMILT